MVWLEMVEWNLLSEVLKLNSSVFDSFCFRSGCSACIDQVLPPAPFFGFTIKLSLTLEKNWSLDRLASK